MVKVSVLKKGKYSFGASFNTKEEADKWIAEQEHKGSWGKKGEYEVVFDDTDFIEISRKDKIKMMIDKRDKMLCATDWLFLPDVKIEPKHRKIYMDYRQYLRDLPQKLNKSKGIRIEPFENYLRRLHPEEFLDGGKGQKIIYKFMYYIKD